MAIEGKGFRLSPQDPRLNKSLNQGFKRPLIELDSPSSSGGTSPKMSRQVDARESANKLPTTIVPPNLNNLRITNWKLRVKSQGKSSKDKAHEYDPSELRLAPFFKCTKCEYRTSTCHKFRAHMKECHCSDKEFHCYYCNLFNSARPKFPTVSSLIDHLLHDHMFLRWQCNICPYRACTSDHLQLHHMSRHPDNYDVAMKENNPDYPCENKKGKQPSRLLYPWVSAIGPRPDSSFFFHHFKNHRLKDSKGEYQCLYCEYKKPRKDKYHLLNHIANDHRDFPLLLYDIEKPDDPVQFNSDKELPHVARDIDRRRKMKLPLNKGSASSDFKVPSSPALPLTPVSTPTDPYKSPQQIPSDPRRRHDSASSCVSFISSESPPQLPEPEPEPLEVFKSVQDEINEQVRDMASRCPPTLFPSIPSSARAPSPKKHDVSDEEDFAQPAPKRRPSGYRPEKDNQLFEPAPLVPSTLKQLKCLMVTNGVTCNTTFLESKKEVHLRIHDQVSALGCHCSGYFHNKPLQIRRHIELNHNGVGKIFNYFVSENERTPTLFEDCDIRPKNNKGSNVTAVAGPSKPVNPAPKSGTLSKKIKECQFLGPSKNERSKKPMPKKDVAPSTSTVEITKIKPVTKKTKKAVEKKKMKVKVLNRSEKVKEKALSSINFSSSGAKVFCLFCEKKYPISTAAETDEEGNVAIECMKNHLEYGFSCLDCGTYIKDDDDARDHYSIHHPEAEMAQLVNDEDDRPGVQHWICDFYNNQNKIFTDSFKIRQVVGSGHKSVYVECPLCAKANAVQGTALKLIRYYDFKEFEKHFYQHARYHSHQCKICTQRVNEKKFETHLRSMHKITDSKQANKHFVAKRDNIEKLLENIVDEKRREFDEKLKSPPPLEEEEEGGSSESSESEDSDSEVVPKTKKKSSVPVVIDLESDDGQYEKSATAKKTTGQNRAGPSSQAKQWKQATLGPSVTEKISIWYRKEDIYVQLDRNSELDERAIREMREQELPDPGEPSKELEVIAVSEPVFEEAIVPSGSTDQQNVDEEIQCDTLDLDSFYKTLTDQLPLGCKYCCKPEARFLKRLDMKNHIRTFHPNEEVKFLTKYS